MMALALGSFATIGILTVLLLFLSDPLAAPARLLLSLGLAAGRGAVAPGSQVAAVASGGLDARRAAVPTERMRRIKGPLAPLEEADSSSRLRGTGLPMTGSGVMLELDHGRGVVSRTSSLGEEVLVLFEAFFLGYTPVQEGADAGLHDSLQFD